MQLLQHAVPERDKHPSYSTFICAVYKALISVSVSIGHFVVLFFTRPGTQPSTRATCLFHLLHIAGAWLFPPPKTFIEHVLAVFWPKKAPQTARREVTQRRKTSGNNQKFVHINNRCIVHPRFAVLHVRKGRTDVRLLELTKCIDPDTRVLTQLATDLQSE